jgi:hypothetical protein
MFHDLEVRGRN